MSTLLLDSTDGVPEAAAVLAAAAFDFFAFLGKVPELFGCGWKRTVEERSIEDVIQKGK